jgi:hypothetical protein
MNLLLLEFGAIMAVLVLSVTIGLWTLTATRRQRRQQQMDMQRVFEQLDLSRTDLLILSEHLTQKVTDTRPLLESRNPSTPQSPAGAVPRAYEMAARLARGGASCEELMTGCALSRHEAGLLLRLHAPAKTVGKENAAQRLSLVG